MARMPWGAWYEPDYRADTLHFTCAAQDGIYKNLLHAYFMNGPLVDIDAELRATARATVEEWQAHWPGIRARYFIQKRGHLHNKRADKERDKSVKLVDRRSEAGKVGAAARWSGEPEDPGPAAAPPQPEPKPKKPRKAPADKGTILAEDWKIDERCHKYGRAAGLTNDELEFMRVRFIRYWTGPDAKEPRKIDWYRTWCNNIDLFGPDVIKRRIGRGQSSRHRSTPASAVAAGNRIVNGLPEQQGFFGDIERGMGVAANGRDDAGGSKNIEGHGFGDGALGPARDGGASD